MKQTLNSALIFLLLLSVLQSCRKAGGLENPSIAPAQSEVPAAIAPANSLTAPKKLKKINLLNNTFATFQYNAAGRIYKVVHSSDSILYTYTSTTMTIRKYGRYSKELMSILKGKLNAKGCLMNLSGTEGNMTINVQYTYDAANRLVQRTGTYSDANTTVNSKAVYTWSNGDLVKETFYENNQLNYVNQYTYDLAKENKLNIMQAHNFWVDSFLGVPNKHLRTKYVMNAGSPGQFTVSEVWTLNAQGEPTLSKLTSSLPLPFGLKSLDYTYFY
ncbi:MAG TPA: hypothetical protein VHK69_22220 [Chitinophagaceae bacterium]|jgi:hypothetical protein|nr:hypothetical protein [Chitinophagaceae bacterium]